MNDDRERLVLDARIMGQRLLEYADYIEEKPPPQRMTRAREDIQHLARRAEIEYLERRTRSHHFNSDLFGEPAWDIMLDLFYRQVFGKSISITDLSIAGDVPPTTSLRYLSILKDAGLVYTAPDPRDQRRNWVRLTDEGLSKMIAVFKDRSSSDGQKTNLAITMTTPESRGRLRSKPKVSRSA